MSIFDVSGADMRWTVNDTVDVFVVFTNSKKTHEKTVRVVNTAISNKLLSSSIEHVTIDTYCVV